MNLKIYKDIQYNVIKIDQYLCFQYIIKDSDVKFLEWLEDNFLNVDIKVRKKTLSASFITKETNYKEAYNKCRQVIKTYHVEQLNGKR